MQTIAASGRKLRTAALIGYALVIAACGSDAALQQAIDALRHLEEFKDSNASIYDERYTDAERAVAQVSGTAGSRMDDCLRLFRSYRGTQVGLDLAKQTDIDKYNEASAKFREELNSCIASAKGQQ